MNTSTGAVLRLSIVPSVSQWQLVSNTLVPGAHVAVICKGGTSSYHRMTVNLEDAGFEIRDQILWIGSTIVPIALARKPLEESTVAANVLKYGAGGINVDACRITATDFSPKDRIGTKRFMQDRPWNDKQATEGRPRIVEGHLLGRFPANLILTIEAGKRLDEQSGFSQSTNLDCIQQARTPKSKGAEFQRVRLGEGYSDSGGASRFFKCCDTEQELVEYLTTMLIPQSATADVPGDLNHAA